MDKNALTQNQTRLAPGKRKSQYALASLSTPQGFEYQSGISGGRFFQKNKRIEREIIIKRNVIRLVHRIMTFFCKEKKFSASSLKFGSFGFEIFIRQFID
jgi:hypothetical protein